MAKAKQLFESYRDRNALKVLANGIALEDKYPWTDGIPPITERGNGKAMFQIGDKVKSTGTGQLIAGVELKITDIWFNNGFANYVTGSIVHRDGELVKA